MTFVHLNAHSKGSILYGSASVKDLISRAKELGQPAIGLTDYSNVYSAIEFYTEAKKQGVKPILGVDLFICEDAAQLKLQKVRQVNHITLLAETDEGWKNIVRLLSLGQSPDYYYYNPRVDLASLEKYKEGVICLTGSSADGLIPYYLYDKLHGDGEIREPSAIFRAEGLVRRLLTIYDSNHLFLEVQQTGVSQQEEINDRLRLIGKKYGVPTVATNNVHYSLASDAAAHKTLLDMSTNKFNMSTYTDFTEEEYYIKSREEMVENGFTDDELDLTLSIADRCNVEIDLKKRRLPQYKFIPDGKIPIQYLRELVEKGYWNVSKISDVSESYEDRLERELADIEEMGFADYFLIVHDVVSWCHSKGMLLGRGRGSVGGSLVAYCLGITNIDPLEYGLIWERFLNKGRGGLPDIDTDVPRSRRKEVIAYIKERFGEGNVAQLVTLGGLQAKAVLKDVFRVFNMPFDEANKITALVPAKNDDHVAISLQEAIDAVPELAEYAEKYKPWFQIALSLEGCYKSIGIHAGAVLISDKPFDESEYPLVRNKDGNLIFGWDMNTVDSLSLLKLDILGLTTLDDIQVTRELVKHRRDIDLVAQGLPLDDSVTYAMLGRGFTIGVFQIEKQLGRTWSKNLEPESIEQLSDLVSIIRPGPMESGMHTSYRAVKIKGDDPAYIHPTLEPIMGPTYSALLYQEQVIQICRDLAGMNLVDADKVRKAMGKKKPEEMNKWKDVFVDGCEASGIDIVTAEDIWGYIEKFAGYGFNKSHGVGYALMSYETAYLKANYTLEFLCAKLRHAESHTDKYDQLSALVYDAKLFDIEVLPPRVSQGNKDFAIISDDQIAFGLTALKGVGVTAITDIVKLRKKCTSFDEVIWYILTNKTKVNSGVMNALIKGGAFDDQQEHRVRSLARFELLDSLTAKERETVQTLMEQNPDVDDWVRFIRAISDESKVNEIKERFDLKLPNVRRRGTIRGLLLDYDGAEIFDTKSQRIVWEKYFLGISLSGSEADIYKADYKCVDIVKNGYAGMSFEIAICVTGVRQIETKKGDPMAFVTANDDTYHMDNIVVFPKTFDKCHRLLDAGNVLKIRGKLDDRGSLIANIVERLK